MALHELSVDFEPIEVNLKDKPASLFEVNSKGLVPAMKDQSNCINDSYIILQYIDETWSKVGHHGLLPECPAKRAVARTWCEYINNQVVKPFYEILLRQNDEEREKSKANLLNAIKTIDEAMRSVSNGPFFFNSAFGIVDIMLAPHVERFPALNHYRGFEIPSTDDFKRFHLWWEAVQARPSFQPARVTTDFVISVYKSYADGTASSKVAESIRKGKPIV